MVFSLIQYKVFDPLEATSPAALARMVPNMEPLSRKNINPREHRDFSFSFSPCVLYSEQFKGKTDGAMSDDHLPVKAEEKPCGAYLWIIEAPWEVLDGFCRQAGLDRDSAVPLVFTLKPDRFAAASLTYPSAKCTRPEPWLQVLALLHLHHYPFKLYQATGEEGALASLILLRPAIDKELGDVLGLAAQGRIMQLQGYTRMLQEVFTRLEGAANIKPEF
jgi:hypothetical protein